MSYVGSHFSSIDPIHKPHNRNFCCCLLSCSIRHSLAIFVESSIRRIENFYNNHSAKTSLISLLQTLNVNKKQHTFGICFLFFGFFSIFVGFRKKKSSKSTATRLNLYLPVIFNWKNDTSNRTAFVQIAPNIAVTSNVNTQSTREEEKDTATTRRHRRIDEQKWTMMANN